MCPREKDLPARSVPLAVVLRFVLSPRRVGLLLDPAHAAELTIKGKDATHGLGFGRVDDERSLARLVAPRHVTAHPHPLLLRGGDLIADPFAGALALEL